MKNGSWITFRFFFLFCIIRIQTHLMHIWFPTERISNVFDISPFNSSIRRPSDTEIIASNGMIRCFFSLVIERKSPDDRKSTNEIHQRKRYSDECLSTCLKLTYARQLHFCVQLNSQAKLCVFPKHDGSECNRMSKLSLIPININDMVHTVCINTSRIQCKYIGLSMCAAMQVQSRIYV